MSTNRTTFCGRGPPTNLQHRTDLLFALVFEFLHELPKGEVRNLFTKEAFHAVADL